MKMDSKKNLDEILNLLNQQRVSENYARKRNLEDIEFITNKDSRFIPIKLTKEEIIKAHKCQKAMLGFMFRQYQQSIGTEKEEHMKKLYNDAVADYNEFVNTYKRNLFNK